MKKISAVILLSIFCLKGWAQTPVIIKDGTTLQFNFDLHGQHAAFEIEVGHAADTLALNWKIRGLAGGTYLISPAALNNGTHLNFAQPEPFKKVQLAADETFCMISKNAFKDLKSRHQFVYDHTTYILKDDVKENPVMLENQSLNVLHVTAQDETTEFWILDNLDFPFICQIKNNPLGIDYVLNHIGQP